MNVCSVRVSVIYFVRDDKVFCHLSFVFRFCEFREMGFEGGNSNVYSMEHEGKKALAPDR